MPLAPKIISELQQIVGAVGLRIHRYLPAQVLTMLLVLAGFAPNSPGAENPPQFLWANQFGEGKTMESCGLATDGDGNSYVTGISGFKQSQSLGTHGWHRSGGEVFLAKFSPEGKKLWTQTAGGNGTDNGIAVAADQSNNVFVTGYFSGTVKFQNVKLKAFENTKTRSWSPADIFLAKYNPDGKLLWVRQAGGAQLDLPYGVATDKKGNAYVTGYFQGEVMFGDVKLQSRTQPDNYHDPDTDYGDIFVAKYNADGQIQWVRQAGEFGKNIGYSIATDDIGRTYITGSFGGRGRTNAIQFDELKVMSTNLSSFIAKYDPNGKILWAKPTAGFQYYRHNQLGVDTAGHAFVAGDFRFSEEFASLAGISKSGRNSDLFLAKYDADGKVLWCKLAGGQAVGCYGLALAPDGNTFVAGYFDEAATFDNVHIHAQAHAPQISGYESFLARYSPDGEVTWCKHLDRNIDIRAITSDKNGLAYLTGTFNLPITLDKITLKPPTSFLKEQILDERTSDLFVSKLRIK
jgi:hypothetical protein